MLKGLFYIILALILIGIFSEPKDEIQNNQAVPQTPSKVQSSPSTSVETPKLNSKWYEGGNLHKTSVGEWRTATYENQLATTADWSISRPQIEAKVRISGIDALKPFAVELLTCINEAAGGQGYEKMAVAELAASCMLLMKW